MPDLLLAADIFGHTPELQALARSLAGAGRRARIVSPYGDARPRFASEMEAYAAFCASTTPERYAEAVARELAQGYGLAVGFSAGATALWVALATPGITAPGRSVLYYGSRIRDHAHLRPAGNPLLLFAQREASFDSAELAAQLRGAGVDAGILPGTAHGFMNRLSTGFDGEVYETEMTRLRELLKQPPAGTPG
jgi:dienelactone hydrolase